MLGLILSQLFELILVHGESGDSPANWSLFFVNVDSALVYLGLFVCFVAEQDTLLAMRDVVCSLLVEWVPF